jgi:hypothetical protein
LRMGKAVLGVGMEKRIRKSDGGDMEYPRVSYCGV